LSNFEGFGFIRERMLIQRPFEMLVNVLNSNTAYNMKFKKYHDSKGFPVAKFHKYIAIVSPFLSDIINLIRYP